jgi:predicted DNA-binding protein (UPF0251 family)
MARPHKCRYIKHAPEIKYFKPWGIPLSSLEEVVLGVDEYESLRLADLEALSQEEAAKRMKISRATFGRVIEKARQTVIDAIVNGKAIRIRGGNYRTSKKFEFYCRNCKRSWRMPIIADKRNNCPYCKLKG